MALQLGYIIINPEKNAPALRNTISSIGRQHIAENPEIIHILPKGVSNNDLKVFKDHCPDTYKGQETITSLLNIGYSKIKSEYGLVLFAGTIVKTNLQSKYERVFNSYKDIFYPIVGGKYNFVEGTINGLAMSKKLFQEIGDFPENFMWKCDDEETNINSFEVCKLLWSLDAMKQGCKFKAMMGCKFS